MCSSPNSPEAGPTAAQQGALAIVLHAHLPECRRPGQPASLEETWFFEAMAECYLPLVQALDRLEADRVPGSFTLSISPPLLAMLRDPALLERFETRLQDTLTLADRDSGDISRELAAVAAWHAARLRSVLKTFRERCRRDLPGTLLALHRAGRIELATTAATHAFLPAHQSNPAAIRAQIRIGLDAFETTFGFRPRFFWLPECGFFPGLDSHLAAEGIRTTGLESHGVRQARPRPAAGVRRALRCPSSGLMVLGRDNEISRIVWSAAEGYPGDPCYREFYRDRIHDFAAAELPPSFAGRHLPAGLKYWRVTGCETKRLYDRDAALARVRDHAEDFVGRLRHGVARESGVWFAPFDAELFGHWWFEGPEWLERVLRKVAAEPRLEACNASDAAARFPGDTAMPAASTWGQHGDFSFWINRDTAWIYPQLNMAWARFTALLRAHRGDADPLTRRALRHAGRLLLLAQASDWPFLIRAGVSVGTAMEQLAALLADFDTLAEGIASRQIDPAHLAASEAAHPLFENLDLAAFDDAAC